MDAPPISLLLIGLVAAISLANAAVNPEAPKVGEVKSDTSVKLKLRPLRNANVYYYYVMVVPYSDRRRADDISIAHLKEGSASTGWIAAEFMPSNLPEDFILGDGRRYGEYQNRPLQKNQEYKAFLKVIGQEDTNTSPYSERISTGPVDPAAKQGGSSAQRLSAISVTCMMLLTALVLIV